MTQKEKLIELIDAAIISARDNYGMPFSEDIADFLLANGVVVLPCKVGDEVRLNSKISSNSQIEKIEDIKVLFVAKTYFFSPDDVLKGRVKICKKYKGKVKNLEEKT